MDNIMFVPDCRWQCCQCSNLKKLSHCQCLTGRLCQCQWQCTDSAEAGTFKLRRRVSYRYARRATAVPVTLSPDAIGTGSGGPSLTACGYTSTALAFKLPLAA